MSVKHFLIKAVSDAPFLRHCVIRTQNKLRLNGNAFDVSDIHFQKNLVEMQESEQSFSLESGSFMKNCIVRMSGKRNHVSIGSETVITDGKRQTFFICGNDNRIVIGGHCRLDMVSFFIRGHGNTIMVGDDCSAVFAELHLEGDGNTIQIGNGTTMHGRGSHSIHIATDEGSGVYIDEDCMLAHSVQMRSTDSHSIVDLNGKRLNPARDIRIGRHCWLGMQSIILKGCVLEPNTVVAAGSVCGGHTERIPNCILAGNPAKVVKRDVNWDRKFV